MAEFKETRRQAGIQKKHSTGRKRSENKTKTFLGQICYKFRTRNTVLHNTLDVFYVTSFGQLVS